MTLPKDEKDKGEGKAAKPSHLAPERHNLKRTPTGEIGTALRSVYDGALNEQIPPEMLDLLGKLD